MNEDSLIEKNIGPKLTIDSLKIRPIDRIHDSLLCHSCLAYDDGKSDIDPEIAKCKDCIKMDEKQINTEIILGNLARIPKHVKRRYKIICFKCKQEMRLKDFKLHFKNECALYCSKGCGILVEEAQRKDHEENHCTVKKTECIGGSSGKCDKRDQRIKILYHQLKCEKVDGVKEIEFPLYSKMLYILIGVGKYSDKMKDLKAPIKDVYKMKKCLEGIGFERNEGNILLNENASKSNILHFLKRFNEEMNEGDEEQKKINSESMLLVYFSGHGGERDKKIDYHICPHDYDPSTKENAICLEDFKKIFLESKSKHILLVLDSCHSGGILRYNYFYCCSTIHFHSKKKKKRNIPLLKTKKNSYM